MSIELKIPEVGESVQEVYIVKWLKNEGDRFEEDEDLVELESEKASIPLPARGAGVVEKILYPAGSTVAVGQTVAILASAPATVGTATGPAASTTAAAPVEGKGESRVVSAAPGTAAEETAAGDSDRPASPSARRELRKHGLQPSDVPAAGKRLTREDVEQFVRGREESETTVPAAVPVPAAPAPAAAGRSVATTGAIVPAGSSKLPAPLPPAAVTAPATASAARKPAASAPDERWVPLSPIRRRIAERLVRGQHEAALLTTFNEIDMSAVMELRRRHQDSFQKRYGVKLGFMSFFVKAVTTALQQIPELNAQIRDEHIVYRDSCHIGVAVGTKRGLLVPVLRHAETMTFAGIETSIRDFAERADAGKLSPDELQGGTFTISNGGVYGSLLSTPLINPPQSGVLGMHAIQERPVGINGQIVLRPMMYVALTYDHRLVDGREAVTFLLTVKQAIEDPSRLLLEA
jgi:2-oxoglutarate dehydrogenase E2 component (dihydrolipoamide succinyltransferase)